MDALRRGRFYGSAGPLLLDVAVEEESVVVRCSPARSVRLRSGPWDGCSVNADPAMGNWRGEALERDAAGLVTDARFELPEFWRWARVEVEDERGRRAWSNPFRAARRDSDPGLSTGQAFVETPLRAAVDSAGILCEANARIRRTRMRRCPRGAAPSVVPHRDPVDSLRCRGRHRARSPRPRHRGECDETVRQLHPEAGLSRLRRCLCGNGDRCGVGRFAATPDRYRELHRRGAGTFDSGDNCLLEPSGAFSSKCTVSYTPAQISGGEHALLGTYEGDVDHGRATTRFALEVTPANDEPDNATRLLIPAKITGTTEGATWEYEDPNLCGDAYAPIWYTVKPTRSGRAAVRLTVRGRVDSVVAVFRLDRSKLVSMGCSLTDVSGVAGVSFDAARGTAYLIAVAAPWDARVGGFTLETASVPPVKLSGALLARDAQVTLDPLLRPGAAFSVRLEQGVTYRINASTAPTACVQVLVLHPSARSANEVVGRSAGCEGYLLYTPARGLHGSFPLIVNFAEPPAPKPKPKGSASAAVGAPSDAQHRSTSRCGARRPTISHPAHS